MRKKRTTDYDVRVVENEKNPLGKKGVRRENNASWHWGNTETHQTETKPSTTGGKLL